jgi:hypothetical protein
MAVTRYQFRLSVYLSTVVVTALVAASPRLISWIVRTPRDYVSVEFDGKRSYSTRGPGYHATFAGKKQKKPSC